jgi:quinol monooxygenase YgiN
MSHMSREHVIAVGLAALIAVDCSTPAFAQEKAGFRYEDVPQAAFAIVAEVRAKPGMADKLREATLPLVTQVRSEPNNLLYFLHENREEPGHFIFYEIFASQADFDDHNATPHVQAWFARLPELADGGVKVMRMELRGNGTAFPW